MLLPEPGQRAGLFFVNIYYVVIKFGHQESHQLVHMYYHVFTFLTLVHSHSLFKPNGQLCSWRLSYIFPSCMYKWVQAFTFQKERKKY